MWIDTNESGVGNVACDETAISITQQDPETSHDANKMNVDDESNPVVFASCFSLLAAAVHPCFHLHSIQLLCTCVSNLPRPKLTYAGRFSLSMEIDCNTRKTEVTITGTPVEVRGEKLKATLSLYHLNTHDP